MMKETIIVDMLTKKFGQFIAVDSITFSITEGTIFGFLGANGAGKSTAIRMMCGLLEPTSGQAIIAGHNVSSHPEKVKQSIGYMSQRFSLYNDITVAENIRFFGGVYGLRGKQLRERTEWILDSADLRGRADHLTADLPGGIKQRLALGCALVHEPGVLFLDEPTSGVDPLSRRRFWELIQKLADDGVTILVTTHFLDEAEYCNQIALIDAGKIIATGTPGSLKSECLPYPILEIVSEQPLQAYNLLQGIDFVREVSLFGLSLHVGVNEINEASQRLTAIFHKNGLPTPRLNPIQPSMEDVFIHLISRKESI